MPICSIFRFSEMKQDKDGILYDKKSKKSVVDTYWSKTIEDGEIIEEYEEEILFEHDGFGRLIIADPIDNREDFIEENVIEIDEEDYVEKIWVGIDNLMARPIDNLTGGDCRFNFVEILECVGRVLTDH